MLSKEQIKDLARYLWENMLDNPNSIEECISKWIKKEFACSCSRCTKLPNSDDFYD